ncbi:MAG: hypothetical protein E7403_07600 [Ruminococcaceae bacterium]|nr:hypothetical protein [Oscillospiraceae bacterium]
MNSVHYRKLFQSVLIMLVKGRGYKSKIKCYIKPAIGDIFLRSLKTEHIQRMVNDMHYNGLSPKNIRDTLNNVNAAMKKASSLSHLRVKPLFAIYT